jgi:hypothetical protein
MGHAEQEAPDTRWAARDLYAGVIGLGGRRVRAGWPTARGRRTSGGSPEFRLQRRADYHEVEVIDRAARPDQIAGKRSPAGTWCHACDLPWRPASPTLAARRVVRGQVEFRYR